MLKQSLIIVLLPILTWAQFPGIEAHALADLDMRSCRLLNPAQATKPNMKIGQGGLVAASLPELSRMGLFIGKSKGNKNYALGLEHFGPAHYQLSTLRLAFGLALNKAIGLGISLALKTEKVVEQAREQDMGLSLHWDYHAFKKWAWAGSFRIASAQKKALAVKQQFWYHASKEFHCLAGLRVMNYGPSSLSMGLIYFLSPQVKIRQGFVLGRQMDYRAGLGFSLDHWEFHLSFQWQKALGHQEGLGLSYKW